MAVDMYMVVENGAIKGETRDAVYSAKGGIDVLSWSWGLSQAGYAHYGTGSGTGKVTPQDLTFTKYVDLSTSYFMSHLCFGKHFKDALLVMRKVTGGKPLDYLTIKMEQVLVTSWHSGASGGQDRLTETLTLNFAKVTIDYSEQKADGSKGKNTPMSFSFAENQK
jgi:type VI secretion system secreted protein Hcp